MTLPEVIKRLRSHKEHVPHPHRLPTETEVAAAESELGLSFPPDYRYYLLHASDVTYGTTEPGLVTPDAGRLDLVQVATEAWSLGVPKELLPFCESNGDYFCLQPDGVVISWSQGPTEETWPNIGRWIQEVWIEGQEAEEEE